MSTRKADDPVQGMGGRHVPRTEVSPICQELDAGVALSRDRPPDDAVYPACVLTLPTRRCARGHIVSQAVVVALGCGRPVRGVFW